jgi:hypothetical protein
LGFHFKEFPADAGITKSDVDKIFAMAFDKWSKVIPMSFNQVDRDPNITIQWTSRIHNHPDKPFNSDDELAHGFGPFDNYTGFICFNNDVQWSKNENENTERISIINNAVHEIGHILDVRHNLSNENSVMWPYYPQKTILDAEDISYIQSLYGER